MNRNSLRVAQLRYHYATRVIHGNPATPLFVVVLNVKIVEYNSKRLTLVNCSTKQLNIH